MEDISNNQITLVVVSKENYLNNLSDIVTQISGFSSKICYVSLNRPYNSILSWLDTINVDKDKFYFVDVLTSTVTTPPEVDNCSFVESPNALTDLSISFAEAMGEKNCDNSLFDTISSLIIHEPAATIIKLSQNLMTRLRVEGKKAVFITLREDSEELIKDLMMFVDKVIEL